jgi:TonB family protein
MFKPCIAATAFLSTAVLISLCLASIGLNSRVCAQQSTAASGERVRGINFYNQGNDKEAIEALRQAVKQRKDDLSAWHYLGLALARQGKTDDARKAYEQAVKLGEKMLDGILEFASPDNFSASVKPYGPLLEEAADSADKYLVLSSKLSKSKAQEWSDRATMLRDYVQVFETDGNGNNLFKVYSPRDVTTKARILSRTEPEYTDEARNNHVAGTIVLRGIFAFDGKVRGLRVMSGLPYGLTERALRAARKIKFVPAMKDGKPVSQYIQIEYNFNLF